MVTLEIRILERSRFRLFAVEGKENLLELVFAALIIIGFFLIAVRRA